MTRQARFFLLAATLIPVAVFQFLALGFWRDALTGHPPHGVDYVHFYSSGRLVIEEPSGLYDLDRQKIAQDAASGWGVEALPFAYLPVVAAIHAPLARTMSFERAYSAVVAFEMLLAALCLWVLARSFRLPASSAAWLAVIAAWSLPIYQTIYLGQLSLLLLLVLSLHVAAVRAHRDVLVGITAGLLLLKPTLLPIPILALVVSRRWRSLAAAFATMGVLVLLSALIAGPAAVVDWARAITVHSRLEGSHGVNLPMMLNLRALLAAVVPSRIVTPVWVVAASACAFAALALHRRPVPSPRAFAWRWTATVFAMAIVAPHLYRHDLAILLVPAALHLGLVDARGEVPIRAVAIALLAAIAVALPPAPTAALALSAFLVAWQRSNPVLWRISTKSV